VRDAKNHTQVVVWGPGPKQTFRALGLGKYLTCVIDLCRSGDCAKIDSSERRDRAIETLLREM
jgi:hypothetical protein